MSESYGQIGHNLPPTDAAPIIRLLTQMYAGTEESNRSLLQQARNLPTTVGNDADLEAYAVVIRKLRDQDAQIEAYRKVEKEPHLRSGEAVDGFFKSMRDRLGKALQILHLRADDYQQIKLEAERRAREAEALKAAEEARNARGSVEEKLKQQRQAMAAIQAKAKPADMARTRFADGGGMATMTRVPSIEITDFDALPLDILRPHIPRSALHAAVAAWAKTTNYSQSLPGARIEMIAKTVIR